MTFYGEFGSVTDRGRYITVQALDGQTYDRAHRSGTVWPCSVLADCDRVLVELDAENGDLVDLSQWGSTEEIPGDELTAWVDDCLARTPYAQLARGTA